MLDGLASFWGGEERGKFGLNLKPFRICGGAMNLDFVEFSKIWSSQRASFDSWTMSTQGF